MVNRGKTNKTARDGAFNMRQLKTKLTQAIKINENWSLLPQPGIGVDRKKPK